uniref:Secreted protein n=1 Tax=Oryza barthii TaxID=65489 RepID=A0A0D3GY40_9ORYZ
MRFLHVVALAACKILIFAELWAQSNGERNNVEKTSRPLKTLLGHRIVPHLRRSSRASPHLFEPWTVNNAKSLRLEMNNRSQFPIRQFFLHAWGRVDDGTMRLCSPQPAPTLQPAGHIRTATLLQWLAPTTYQEPRQSHIGRARRLPPLLVGLLSSISRLVSSKARPKS